jgi:hypothetical protein
MRSPSQELSCSPRRLWNGTSSDAASLKRPLDEPYECGMKRMKVRSAVKRSRFSSLRPLSSLRFEHWELSLFDPASRACHRRSMYHRIEWQPWWGVLP